MNLKSQNVVSTGLDQLGGYNMFTYGLEDIGTVIAAIITILGFLIVLIVAKVNGKGRI